MREPGYGTLKHFYTIPLYALARFGKWNIILQEPAPAEELHYPNGIWHFVRGLAFVRTDLVSKSEDAQRVKNNFETAWKWADIKLTSSRF